MKVEQTNMSNQQTSLENWVEKYLPLKMQHQIAETVGEVLNDDQKDQFYEISRQMAKVLRREIIHDTGNSSLKKSTLDLITNLRLERNILGLDDPVKIKGEQDSNQLVQ